MTTKDELRKYLADQAQDEMVDGVEHGKCTIPGIASAQDADLDLGPLGRKKFGTFGDEYWSNPRTPHFLASKITLPRKDGSQMELDLARHDKRFHPGGWKEGQECKFRDEMNKKVAEAKKADQADTLKDYLGGKEPEPVKIDPEMIEKNLLKVCCGAFANEHNPEIFDFTLNGNEFVTAVCISTDYKGDDMPNEDDIAQNISDELAEGSEVSVEELPEERTSEEPEPQTYVDPGTPGFKGYVYLVKGKLSEEDMHYFSQKV